MKQTLIFLFLFFSFFNSYGQKDVLVKGKVVEEGTNLPLEYATITFKNPQTTEIVSGTVTDTKGEFSVDVAPGTYTITVEYISYKSKTYENKLIDSSIDLGSVSLSLNVEALDAVEVIAETTTVQIKLDKKIYNIGKDLTTAGGTVSDALNNVPSVAVDIDGAISLRGNENVRILINGKPSALAGFGDSNVLGQLPAEAIERVEVITSPSARYDAEGTAGILNIILRQKETLGFNGSFNFTIGNPDNVGLSSNINYRTEKYNLFSNLGWRYFNAPRNSFNNTTYFDRIVEGNVITPEYEQIIEDSKVDRINRNYNGNLGMEYFLSEKTSITGSLFFRFGNDEDIGINNSRRFNDNELEERTRRQEIENQERNSYQLALNYITKFNDEGHELTADLQYEKDNRDEYANIIEDYITTNQSDPEPFQEERIFQDEVQKETLIQADYVLPIGKDARFEAGYRGNFENEITDYLLEQEDITDGSFFINDTISNVFDYSENINALYTQYGTKFGKFSFLLGLRLENTQLKGKIDSRLTDEELVEAFGFPIDTDFDNNYLGLFPTLNLIYNFGGTDRDAEESVTFGYNRRINRPRGFFVNPFPSRSSRTNVFQGNPNLNPAFSSTFDLGYLKRWGKFTLTTSVYYQYETDSFERVQENTGQQTSDGIDIIRTIPINLSTNKRTGAELGFLYSHKKWLRLNSSFNFFQFETDGDFNGIDYSAKNTSWFARFSSKVTLFSNIDWQTNMNYRGARQDAQSDTAGIFSIDLALSKELWDNKATVSLNVRDLLNSRKRNSLTTTEFFQRDSEFQWRQRQINLSLIYRFNQKKQQNKRNGNGSRNDDEDFDFEG